MLKSHHRFVYFCLTKGIPECTNKQSTHTSSLSQDAVDRDHLQLEWTSLPHTYLTFAAGQYIVGCLRSFSLCAYCLCVCCLVHIVKVQAQSWFSPSSCGHSMLSMHKLIWKEPLGPKRKAVDRSLLPVRTCYVQEWGCVLQCPVLCPIPLAWNVTNPWRLVHEDNCSTV